MIAGIAVGIGLQQRACIIYSGWIGIKKSNRRIALWLKVLTVSFQLSLAKMLSSRMIQAIPRGIVGKLSHRQTIIRSRLMSSNKQPPANSMTEAQREDAARDAHKAMQGYVEARILAKQGKLKSKGRGTSSNTKSQNAIQLSLMISLTLAFIASPILGKKIAQDDEFREKYIPAWYDFRVKSPESAWTREELHEQLVSVERDMRERAIRGEFTPDKLEELKRNLQPRSDLSEEDLHYAKKYGWGKVHPGVDPDEFDDDE